MNEALQRVLGQELGIQAFEPQLWSQFLYWWAVLGVQVIWAWSLGRGWTVAAAGLAALLVLLRPLGYSEQLWYFGDPWLAGLLGVVVGCGVAWPGWVVVSSVAELHTRLGLDEASGRGARRCLAAIVLCVALHGGYGAQGLDSILSWSDGFLCALANTGDAGGMGALGMDGLQWAYLARRWSVASFVWVAPVIFIGLTLELWVVALCGATKSLAFESLRALLPRIAMILGLWIFFERLPDLVKEIQDALLWMGHAESPPPGASSFCPSFLDNPHADDSL